MARNEKSLFLRILDRASVLAAMEEGSGVRGTTPPAEPPPGSAADILTGQLGDVAASVAAQIAAVRNFLRAHPDLLHLLDAAMRDEFAQVEARMRRYTIISNVAFTLIGAALGLLIPIGLSLLGVPVPGITH